MSERRKTPTRRKADAKSDDVGVGARKSQQGYGESKRSAQVVPRLSVVSTAVAPVPIVSQTAVDDLKYKTIDSAADLPQIKVILTDKRASAELSETQRESMVAVGTSSTTAWILVEKSYAEAPSTKVHFLALRAVLRKGGYTVERTGFCSQELIRSVYGTAPSLSESANDEKRLVDEAKLFHEFIEYGVKVRASDAHFEFRGQSGTVRYRVDGSLEPMRNETRGAYLYDQLFGAVAYAYNKLGSARTNSDSAFNAESPQTIMIPYELNGKHMNLRWQSAKEHKGFDVILRFLHAEEAIKVERFQDLGYSNDQSDMLELGTRTSRGLMLIAGITGSGKTTTLKTSLEKIPERSQKKIITVEDPVEYEQQGLTQISIQRKLSDTADTSFKQVQAMLMRCDPDVLMLGEIRDQSTGEAVQVFVETGHQLMATTHADSVMTVFSRLTSEAIGMSLHTLTTPRFWSLIVYQALVPKLCVSCRVPAADVIPDTLHVIEGIFDISTDDMYCRNEHGCPKCNQRGTKGSTVVAEMMQPSRSMLKAIRAQDEYAAEYEWRSTGDRKFDSPIMQGKTVFEHALYKAYLGIIDPRAVTQFDTFERFDKLL